MENQRVIAATDAVSSIGAAIHQLLRESGDTVIGVDINEYAAGSVDQFVLVEQGDSATIDATISTLPDKIDGPTSNAGVPLGRNHSPTTVLKINFYGLREFAQKLLTKMSHGNAIVNLTSGAVATPILDNFLTDFAKRMQTTGASGAMDIARIVALLLDPAYEWINGATIPAERGAIIKWQDAENGSRLTTRAHS